MPFHRNRGVGAAVAVTTVMTAGLLSATPAHAAPEIDWIPCPEEILAQVPPAEQDLFTCAYFVAPLDHADPDAGEAGTTLVRRQATEPEGSQGSLMVNLGGPGMSGVIVPIAMSGLLGEEVLAQYDLIGFDPRGMTLDCFGSPEERERVLSDLTSLPTTAEQERLTLAAFDEYGQACADSSALAPHVSTENIARDLDLMRAALGEERLNFVGMSYGSMIASVYANLYPETTGSLVLDSPVDAALRVTRPLEYDRQRAQGFEDALDELLAQCDEAGAECAFGDGDPRTRFDEVRDGLQENGSVLLEDGEAVTRASLTTKVGDTLQGSPVFGGDTPGDVLAWLQRVSEALEAPTEAPADATTDASEQPAAAGAGGFSFYNDDAFYSINCADRGYPATPRHVTRTAQKWETTMPTFGRSQAFEQYAACSQWPDSEAPAYRGPWVASVDVPPLVLVHEHDAATPVSFAERTADRFPGAGSVRVEGFGHVVLGSNSCAGAVITDYLVNGEVPGEDVSCASEAPVFG
ncbi:alpha/beta hydrolase [Nocardiopsis sp. MG754419]|uniref:alpha/beta hydrolase n=1 Tax=Nocardiopsis sp. MG754419 TaxID=2259865 RepID=UPI001BA45922|nr:alpha/beta hydrolase [Nocardiopsis sp. MG754419]